VFLIIPLAMARAYLVDLPVHAGRPIVEDLHSVHPDIAFPRVGVLGVHAWQGNKSTPVSRPAQENRQVTQRKVSGILESTHDFFAGTVRNAPRPRVKKIDPLPQQRPAFAN